jgi:uncharacterized protein
MNKNELKESIKELIINFHKTGTPELIEREITLPTFKKINKVFVIIGPRRAGKTFVLYQAIKKLLKKGHKIEEIIYLNFENEKLAGIKSSELSIILDAYFEMYDTKKPILFFDEIQNINGWDKFIRRMNDEGYKIYISGSNSKMLSKEIATSLRGRDYPIQVLPLSFKEFLKFKKQKLEKNWEYSKTKNKIKKLFDEYLESSGFPEIVLEGKIELVDQYFKTMLFQDIIERYKITNTDLIKLLMIYLSRQYASDYSINKFNNYAKSNSYKSSTSIIQKYTRILEDTYFCFFLNAKQKSMKKESNYLKKAFLFDHAFINYYNTEKNKGRLLENIVGIELMRRKKQLNYYTNGFECDFITKEQSIQVSYNINENNKKREIRGLEKASKQFKNKGLLLTYDQETIIENIKTIPVWKWLLKE